MNRDIIFPEKLELFLLSLRKEFGNYIVLRGYEFLPKGYSNDIDVFVNKRDLNRFFKCILNIKGINTNIKIIVSRLGLIKCELHLDEEIIPFDILYGFYYFGLNYQNTKKLMLNTVLHESQIFLIPHLSDEVRISLLKELLHNKRVRADKSKYLKEKIEDSFDELPTDFFLPEHIYEIKKSISNKNLILPKLSRKLKIRLLISNFSSYPFKSFYNIFLFILIKYILKNSYHKYIIR